MNDLLILLIVLPLLGISAIAILNTLTFPRLRHALDTPTTAPRVSVLIPARNEASVIGGTITALLQQHYPNFEVLLLDDQSTDGTARLALDAAQGDTRFRLIRGDALPAGWGGKNWACHQLSQHSSGDLLVFTDADVQWSRDALAALVTQIETCRADVFTVWPTQHTQTWSERLVVPLMALVIIGYLPVLATFHLPLPAFGAANGQCLAFRRRAYEQIGGHAAVRADIVEDVRLARRAIAARLRLRAADGAGRIACRMYTGWTQVRDGYAKNILAGYGGSLVFLAFGTLFHWMLFLLPSLLLMGALIAPQTLPLLPPLLLTALGIMIRALTATATRQRILPDALLMPVSVLLMTRIAAQSVYWHLRYRGVRWKERTIATVLK